MSKKALAILGGQKAIRGDHRDTFHWPIVTKEDENAVLAVLRDGTMSANNITKQFENEFADWIGRKYALAFPCGTESIRSAYWAVGVGAGDEVICPTTTFWGTCISALGLGAAINFADICPETLCIDPNDIEHRIGPRTKVLIITHYRGHPCDMEAIMDIVNRHDLTLIEDVSHAQGGFYKGKRLGTFGKVAAMSLMSGKSFACGEAGIMVTDDLEIKERSIAFGFYERTGAANDYCTVDDQPQTEYLRKYAGVPIGGYKHRMNQIAAAMARVQLKYYDQRIEVIQKAMKDFWRRLDDVPGLHPHMVEDEGSTMAGWFSPRGLYRSEELGGLSCARFCEAVRAEGVNVCQPGGNKPLHLHPLFHEGDIYSMGKPTMIAFGQRDVRQGPGTLPVAETVDDTCLGVPWFKHYHSEIIQEYAAAFSKVARNADQLLPQN